MPDPSGISRRIEHSIVHLQQGNVEAALVDLFPAIDKTAKKRRPKARVAERIKGFLRDEEVLISAVGTGNVFKNCKFDRMTFEDAIYKFGRTSIAHEGELDSRLTFVDSGTIQIGKDRWILPKGYVAGMVLAVIVAPENATESLQGSYEVNVLGHLFAVRDIWGKPAEVRTHICDRFRDPGLFG